MAIVKLPKPIKCKRCGHEWVPRQVDVRICPKCKSALWDVPKKGGHKT